MALQDAVAKIGGNVIFRFVLLIIGALSIWNCSADSGVAVSAEREGNMFGKAKNTESYVIASPLAGVLVRDGVPVKNAVLLRRLTWSGNEDGILQEFTTDDQGNFSLPAFEQELKLSFLVQFVGKSKIYFEREDPDHLIWYAPKFSGEMYSEMGGPLKDVVCDLASPKGAVDIGTWRVLTRCSWQ